MLSNNINHFEKAFEQAQQEEKRKGGRFPTTSVWSGLGEVLDLSSGGALIIKRRFRSVPKAETFTLQIKFAEIVASVTARVVRQTKKRGIGKLVAVEFVDTSEEQLEALRDIVRNSRNWRLFDFTDADAA